MTDKHDKDIDEISGVETTGHEWDGIKELNNPLPRWWLWILVITIIWSVGYSVIYPSWPTLSETDERGGTKGTMGWTQYKELKEQQSEIVARRAVYAKRFNDASFEEIMKTPDLYAYAMAGGKAAFGDNCATCHGTGGSGGKGYPNLNDDDWIWGGTLEDIQYTLNYGIRSGHDEERLSEMPSFKDMLDKEQKSQIASYVVGLSKGQTANHAKGAELFADNCAACHGDDGTGLKEMGAPNLADQLWLYAGTTGDIISQMNKPQHGIMPYWKGRLPDETIRQLTIYVHELGGGE